MKRFLSLLCPLTRSNWRFRKNMIFAVAFDFLILFSERPTLRMLPANFLLEKLFLELLSSSSIHLRKIIIFSLLIIPSIPTHLTFPFHFLNLIILLSQSISSLLFFFLRIFWKRWNHSLVSIRWIIIWSAAVMELPSTFLINLLSVLFTHWLCNSLELSESIFHRFGDRYCCAHLIFICKSLGRKMKFLFKAMPQVQIFIHIVDLTLKGFRAHNLIKFLRL